MTTKKGDLLVPASWGQALGTSRGSPRTLPCPWGLNMQAPLTNNAIGTLPPMQRPRRDKEAGHWPRAGCGRASARMRPGIAFGGMDGHRHTHLL